MKFAIAPRAFFEKKLITFEGGHELPKNEQIRNMIDWFELQNK